jgi:hypothetical protein
MPATDSNPPFTAAGSGSVASPCSPTDTERLNWLETQHSVVDGGDGDPWHSWEITEEFKGVPNPDLRELIDAAMKEENRELD